jgi:Spy/CpxP family protein refolding chaperone
MTKQIVAAMLGLLLFSAGGSAQAQEKGRGGFSAPEGTQMRMGQPSPEEIKKRKAEREKWLASLKLTPEQRKKWEEIEGRYAKLMKEKFAVQGGKEGRIMISGSSGDAMKIMGEIQVIQKKKRDEQRNLLTPAQKVIFDKAPDPGFSTRMITK